MNSRGRRFITSFVFVFVVFVGVIAYRAGNHAEPTSRQPPPAAASSAESSIPSWASSGVATRTDVSARRGYYSAPVGARLRFDVETTTTLDFSREPGTAVGVDFRGRLTTTVVARRDDELIFENRYELEPKLRNGAEGAAERLTKELREPIWVRADQDGALVGVRFSPGMGASAREHVRRLLIAFRFTLRDVPEWELEEVDAAGTVGTAYRWVERLGARGGRVERLRGNGVPSPTMHDFGIWPAIEGRGACRIDSDIGWCVEASFDETMKLMAANQVLDESVLSFRGASSGTLHLRSVDTLELREIPDVRWEGDWESLESAGDDVNAGETSPSAEYAWRARLSGATVPSVIARLTAAQSAEPFDLDAVFRSKLDLLWLLRLEPQRLSEVVSIATTSADDAATESLHVLGMLGTAEAQAALATIAVSPTLREDVVIAAVNAMFELEHPNGESLAALGSLIAGADHGSARTAAMLVAGAIAEKCADPRRVVDVLLDARPGNDAQELSTWLTALGNTAHAGVEGAVLEHVDHVDADVRKSAVEALGYVPGPIAETRLVERLRVETDVAVREVAAVALAQRPSLDLARMSSILRTVAEPTVRTAALAALSGRADARENPELRAILEWHCDSDPDQAVRIAARKWIGK